MDAEFKRLKEPWPVDELDVHHYSNVLNQAGQWPPTWKITGGIAPELDNDFLTFKQVVKFAKDRGMKVSCSEYGYDTTAGQSWQQPMDVPGCTPEELQGRWLMRSTLLYLSMGADHVFWFTLQDEPSYQGGGTYTSSGVLKAEQFNPPYKAKSSYLKMVNMISMLKGYTFNADRSTGSVRILEFKKGRAVRYFFWSPTMDNRQVNFMLNNRQLTATEDVQVANTISRLLKMNKANPAKNTNAAS